MIRLVDMTRTTLAIAVGLAGLLSLPACSGGGAAGGGNTTPDDDDDVGVKDVKDVKDVKHIESDRTGPPTPATPEEALVRLFEDLADEVERAENCAAVAGTVSRWVSDNTGRYPELNEAARDRDLTDAQYEAFDARIQVGLVVVVEAMYDCENDAKAQTAFEQFDQLMESI